MWFCGWIIGILWICFWDISSAGPVLGVEGDRLVLPCRPDHNRLVVLVIWFKGDETIYTIDSRDPNNPEYYSTLQNIITGKGYDLIFNPVLKADEGTYRCRVDFKRHSSWNNNLNVSVIVPSTKPLIYSESGDIVKGLIGPFKEGDTLVLTCESKGNPVPSLTWWKENALLDSESEHSEGAVVQNKLTIKKLKRSDLSSLLSCQSSNNNLSIPLSDSVQVDMKFEVDRVRILAATAAIEGKLYKLRCRAWGGHPTIHFTWMLQDRIVAKDRKQVSPNSTSVVSSWSLIPTSDDDKANVTCLVRNPEFPEKTLKHEIHLDVKYPPMSKVITTHSTNLKEGDEIAMRCQVKSNPSNYKVKWRHNGQLMLPESAEGITFEKDNMILKNITKSSAGIYTCVASNSEGDGESNPFSLHINYAPVCKPFQKLTYNVGRKEIVNISCEVDAHPAVTEFHWEYKGASIPSSEWSSDPYQSVLRYRPMTLLDYGTFFCIGKNAAGVQVVPCEFHLNPAGHPDPLSNCTVGNVSESSIQLDCEKGFDGGLPQYFIMEVFRSEDYSLVTNVTSTLPKFFLKGLSPGAKLDLALYSCNSVGRSTPLYLTLQTLGLPLKLTSAPVSMVLLGVGLTSLILIVVLLLVCLLKLRRQPPKVSEKEEVPLKTGTAEDPDVIPANKEIEEWIPLKS